MADIDLKTATEDTSLNIDAFLFGADSQAASSPSVYKVSTLKTLLLGGGSLAVTSAKTLTANNTLTLTGTDGSSVAFGTGGTVLYSGGALGTPSSVTLTNATGLPISTGVSGLGSGVATALAVNTGSAGAPVLFNGAGGTPTSLTLTNATGLPVGGISATGTPSSTTYLRGDGSWATPAGGGGGTPGGSDTQIQFNNAGSFGGLSQLTYSGGKINVVSAPFGLSGNISAATWGTNGIRYANVAATLTDTSAAGTVAAGYTDVFGGNTIAASNARTFTDYYTAFITQPTAGTNVTFTNRWAFGTSGSVLLGGPTLRLGAADAASPVAQTLQVQNVSTGTSNTQGQPFTINGSRGTGTGAGGSIIFQVAPAGTSGTSQNALATALTIDSTKVATFASAPVSSNGFNISSAFNVGINYATTGIGGTGIGNLSATRYCLGTNLTLSSPFSFIWTNSSGTLSEGSNVDTVIKRAAPSTVQLGADDVNTSITVTISIASPALFLGTSTLIQTGMPVVLSTTGALPTGLTAGVTYYAISINTNGFYLATSLANALAGTAINTSGTQSGTHTAQLYPVAQTLQVQSAKAGVSNMPGSDFTISGSRGTGSGVGGSIVFQVAPAGSSGTNQNVLATALTIRSDKTVVVGVAYTVATLPAAGTAGRRAWVTDATAPTYLGTLTGGGGVVCPVFDNGTAWVSA